MTPTWEGVRQRCGMEKDRLAGCTNPRCTRVASHEVRQFDSRACIAWVLSADQLTSLNHGAAATGLVFPWRYRPRGTVGRRVDQEEQAAGGSHRLHAEILHWQPEAEGHISTYHLRRVYLKTGQNLGDNRWSQVKNCFPRNTLQVYVLS